MTREQAIAALALEIATQAIQSGNIDMDLSWLDIDRVLRNLEESLDIRYNSDVDIH
jgi:hypothetical protein